MTEVAQQSSIAKPPSKAGQTFCVVGIGASAGGLEVCSRLVEGFHRQTGMAFILVQHLEPSHESLLAGLLATHTDLAVVQAAEGMLVEPDHIYVIPPGVYLAVSDGALRLTSPQLSQGTRLPIDFLFNSMAKNYGGRAICIILSGTGSDGSLGIKAVKAAGGLVIAQDPADASFQGMPASAIETGLVDMVLPVAKIPAELMRHAAVVGRSPPAKDKHEIAKVEPALEKIISLLRAKTAQDFSLYKSGTLQRRIERRMALLAIDPGQMGAYLVKLQKDPAELDLLAKDLLIHVTSFFRDAKVFALLGEKIIPDLVARPGDHPLRIWIAGCSTGEEAYSLAMLLKEELQAAKSTQKLQIFASDIDPDSVAIAREGFYPKTIEADISPERLARFFTREDNGFRVAADLRSSVVFTVQDVLSDPPFSRLDMVSCRNLLIYLGPDAQARVIALFHFALRAGGILMLGNSETIGNIDGRFEVFSKPERIYHHIGRSRPGDFTFLMTQVEGQKGQSRLEKGPGPSRQAALAELCRRLVMEAYAPAAVLVNARNECLFSLGATNRYMQVAPGHPTHDLFAMTPHALHAKLRAALQRAADSKKRIVVAGCQTTHNGAPLLFSLAVQIVLSEGEELFLVCFLDSKEQETSQPVAVSETSVPRVAELERELDSTRTELRDAIRNLEISGEEQKAINEEAWSVNEEYQSTNEELLTSKEELQSLNEELTALNAQLQETLERQRTTSNDLQNVLYSTDVATIFLDTSLNIRFFTPATKYLFSILPGDVGRPLADLSSLASDTALLDDARAVLQNGILQEREIAARNGVWFIRRILPYRTNDTGVEGVVITFTDVTERKAISDALEIARRQAQLANDAKSRFLAAASHDLRQPLQTLALLQGLLANKITGEREQKLLARFDDTLGAMSGMLNTLLDINQIEAGTVQADIVSFPVSSLLERLKDEFTYNAQAKGLELRVVSCSLTINSDPRLLEQMLRNLLSNALKYTQTGKVLLGCRRKSGKLHIETWDTGIGIPKEELQAIFEEYHQLGNPARERSHGLGLGLAIVQRLGNLLGHKISVTSRPGKGSSFAIEITLPLAEESPVPTPARKSRPVPAPALHAAGSSIMVIEDDPEVRELLEVFLQGEGYLTIAVADGPAAVSLVQHGDIRPNLILADYNLPNGMNGLAATSRLRGLLGSHVPVIILTGDISTATLRAISAEDCLQLNKPVKLKDMVRIIQNLLPQAVAMQAVQAGAASAPKAAVLPKGSLIYVVDDDDVLRRTIRTLLEEDGQRVEDFASCEAFLQAFHPGAEACLLIDAYLPGMGGLELLQHMTDAGHHLPSIMITGHSDVHMAVTAMKAGASDFLEKPFDRAALVASIERALEQSRDSNSLVTWQEDAAKHLSGLTPRQHEVMAMVLAGHPSKNIAADLGISQRTVENHRAAIMKKSGAKSLPALARLALAAAK